MKSAGFKQLVAGTALPLLLFLLPFTLQGQTGSAALTSRIDSLFAGQVHQPVPGYAVAVVKAGQLIHHKGYGLASVEHNIRIDTSTLFSIASLTKQFTAFLILQLAEQGKITLEDPIRQHLPDLAACMAPVKIKHLLYHTSGIRDYFRLLQIAGYPWDGNYTNAAIVRLLGKQQTLNFPPGSRIMYSNSNYVLLAELIEKVTGKAIGACAQERIFAPLGMGRTAYQEAIATPGRALAYSLNEQGQFINQYLSNQTTGNTGMLSTAGDLARWIAHFTSQQVGSRQVFEQLFAFTRLDGGEKASISAGTFVNLPYKGLPRLMNNGHYPGYRSQLFFFPGQQVGIVVLSNFGLQAGVYQKAAQIADLVLAQALQAAKAPRRPLPKVKVNRQVLQSYAGRYEMGWDWAFEVKLEKNALVLYEDSATKYPMIPLSEDRFMVDAEGYQERPFAFKRNAADNQLSLHFGAEHIGVRKAAPAGGPFNPEAYAGKYYSPELETVYAIVAQGDGIKAEHLRNGSLPLKPLPPDAFTAGEWWFGNTTFQRNSKGEIQSFTLAGDGFMGLVFYKMDD